MAASEMRQSDTIGVVCIQAAGTERAGSGDVVGEEFRDDASIAQSAVGWQPLAQHPHRGSDAFTSSRGLVSN